MFNLTIISDRYEVLLYTLYRNISSFLFMGSDSTGLLVSVFILLLGFCTVLTPCFVSMFPLFVYYLHSANSRFLDKFFFAFGIASSIVLIFSVSNLISFYSLSSSVSLISFLSLTLISLNLMELVNFSLIPNTPFIRLLNLDSNSRSYFTGFILGASSAPCNSSIIVLVVFFFKHLNSRIYLLFYTSIYFLGCLVPLLLFLNSNITRANFGWFSSVWKLLASFSGSLLFIFSFVGLLRRLFP